MTPYSHLYLDFYQTADQEGEPLAIGGFLPLDTVYSYEPVPAELTSTEARHILGAQANVWTEYMTTEDHVEYMVFPRMLALSEVVWSPSEIGETSTASSSAWIGTSTGSRRSGSTTDRSIVSLPAPC